MKKKTLEINVTRGRRVKEVLKDNKMTQKELAGKLSYTEQHVSLIVNGDRSLTPDAAQAISRLFPQIRFEWLMGYDNFKTRREYAVYPFAKSVTNRQFEKQGFLLLAAVKGYDIELEDDGPYKNLSLEEFDGLSSEAQASVMGVVVDSCFYTAMRDGKVVARINAIDYNALVAEIADFVEFKMKRLCEGGQ